MEGMTTYKENGITYEVILKRRSGHWILMEIENELSSLPCVTPWVLRFPDGEMVRFRSEYDLWKYALIERKLF